MEASRAPGLLQTQAAISTTCQESSLGTLGFQMQTCVWGPSPETGQVGPKQNELPIWPLSSGMHRCPEVTGVTPPL